MLHALSTLGQVITESGRVVRPGSFQDWGMFVGPRLLDVAIFGFLGIVMMVVGFKIFDLMMPRLDFQVELGEKRNMSLALVIAAFLLSIAIITYAAMHG